MVEALQMKGPSKKTANDKLTSLISCPQEATESSSELEVIIYVVFQCKICPTYFLNNIIHFSFKTI